jgi:hypothetical protein
VQTGQKIAPSQEPSIEVLSGLANGEKVVMP